VRPTPPTKQYYIGTSSPTSITRKSLRRSAAKLLSKDEARRIAANVAKLPELVRPPGSLLPHLSTMRAIDFFEGHFSPLWSIWCDNIRHRPLLGRVLFVKYTQEELNAVI
jgi:hypothetical protein